MQSSLWVQRVVSNCRRPIGLVVNLHTCKCGSREFDSCHHNLYFFFSSGMRENVSK